MFKLQGVTTSQPSIESKRTAQPSLSLVHGAPDIEVWLFRVDWRAEFGGCSSHGAFDGGLELFQLDRLNEMIRETGPQATFNIAIVAETADSDAGNGAYGAESKHQIHAAAIGQRDVADKQIKSIAHRGLKGGADAMGGGNQMSTSNE